MNGFEISNWKPHSKNTLVGFLSLTLPSGMVLHDCTFHEKADSRWIGLPSKRFEKDGATTYSPLIEFSAKEARQRFQEQAVAAVERFLAGGGQ